MQKKQKKSDRPWIPAEARFADTEPFREEYVWQSWGLVIRHLREFTGFDQSVFGRLLQGYTRGQISRYEKEDTEPPIDFWRKLAKTFGLNITWAICGKGLPYITEYADSEERKRFEQWTILVDEKEKFLRDLHGGQ